MASVDLRLLRYFLAVAEEAHLTKAAARLGIRQPPLSQQIRVLEQELGVTLFNRLPRGMELTESGRALLEDARSILALVDQAVDGVRRVSQGEAGRLTVGFTGSAAFHPFVPSVIRRFRESAPNVRLVLEESSTGELRDAVSEGRVDVAFIRGTVLTTPGVSEETVLEETMLAAFPADHPFVKGRDRRQIALSELAEESLILYRRHSGPGLYDAIITACSASGFSPRVVQEAPRMLSTLSLVAAGLGVSLVPASLRRVNIEGVVYVNVTGPVALRAGLNLIWRDAPLSGATRKLIDEVRRHRAEGLDEGHSHHVQ
jgi:DNA-binding transcriptional LysR family regulator